MSVHVLLLQLEPLGLGIQPPPPPLLHGLPLLGVGRAVLGVNREGGGDLAVGVPNSGWEKTM